MSRAAAALAALLVFAPAPRAAAQAAPPAGEALYGPLADAAADAVGLDRRLIRAVVRVESAWRPGAVSPAGAVGLMHVLPSPAGGYADGVDLSDPAENLAVGAYHLRRLVERHGVVRALAAWNAGEGALARGSVFSSYRETRRFVARVLQEVEAASGSVR